MGTYGLPRKPAKASGVMWAAACARNLCRGSCGRGAGSPHPPHLQPDFVICDLFRQRSGCGCNATLHALQFIRELFGGDKLAAGVLPHLRRENQAEAAADMFVYCAPDRAAKQRSSPGERFGVLRCASTILCGSKPEREKAESMAAVIRRGQFALFRWMVSGFF